MRCEEARQYFDAYLDGELSPALATELGAHRLRCADCRRRLALLEVSGHIIAADRDPVGLQDGFTHRLLACMEAPAVSAPSRVQRWLYIGAPLAAAAVVALAFVGAFDRRTPNLVLGEKAINEASFDPLDEAEDGLAGADEPSAEEQPEPVDPSAQAMQHWIESGKSLGQMFNMTILQTLDILEEAKHASGAMEPYPGTAAPNGAANPKQPAPHPAPRQP